MHRMHARRASRALPPLPGATDTARSGGDGEGTEPKDANAPSDGTQHRSKRSKTSMAGRQHRRGFSPRGRSPPPPRAASTVPPAKLPPIVQSPKKAGRRSKFATTIPIGNVPMAGRN